MERKIIITKHFLVCSNLKLGAATRLDKKTNASIQYKLKKKRLRFIV